MRKPTLREKVEMYERLLHKLQLHYAITMRPEVVNQLLHNIDRWSYAHRQGNGELSEREQQQLVTTAFHKLLDVFLDV